VSQPTVKHFKIQLSKTALAVLQATAEAVALPFFKQFSLNGGQCAGAWQLSESWEVFSVCYLNKAIKDFMVQQH